MTGLDIKREEQELDGSEWHFGAFSPTCIYAVDLENRDDNLPQGELQKGQEDFQDCVTRAYINILETKFTYAYRTKMLKDNQEWLIRNGYIEDGRVAFSDRFISIKSNTTRTGNSLKAPVHAIHEYGLIPKKLLPRVSTMTWDEYHGRDSITSTMEKLGKEFLARFNINYEQVSLDNLEQVLRDDMAAVGVFAWPSPVDGEYPRVDYPFTHAVMAFNLPKTYIYDNYPETASDRREWVKKLASDYRFYDHGYRVYVSKETTTAARVSVAVSIISRIVDLYRQVVSLFLEQQKKTTSQRENLYDAAKDFLGKDARPLKLAPQDLGCAEAVCTVVNSVDGLFPKDITYTPTLKKHLDSNPYYRQTVEYRPGCIIISPTISDQFIGHVGIVGENEVIYSNNSETGLWDDYYTLETWIKRYRRDGKLKIYFYEPV